MRPPRHMLPNAPWPDLHKRVPFVLDAHVHPLCGKVESVNLGYLQANGLSVISFLDAPVSGTRDSVWFLVGSSLIRRPW